MKVGSPAHATYHLNVNSLDCYEVGLKERPVKIEILEPDVKELLATCALYNLDQVPGLRLDHLPTGVVVV
jgi:hypothetical protein